MSWLPLPSRVRRGLLSRRLRKRRIPLRIWLQVEKTDPLLARFDRAGRLKLRMLASKVIWRTHFFAARGMVLTELMKACLATRIAIVVFGLEDPEQNTSLVWLRNWRELIVYPSPFKPHRQPVASLGGSPLGLVMHTDPVESGETSYQGPLIISWQDTKPRTLHSVPAQVLIHELAHKLDMLDGYSNGHPPLHASMDQQVWHDTFEAAYLHLRHRVQTGHKHELDSYAATSPAEFFAVCSEYFFAAPERLQMAYPDVYRQLSLFYKQQPVPGKPVTSPLH
jgi:Mlc titration factor MtfA (ptsG expression regulator)